jgi:hypothetical protein
VLDDILKLFLLLISNQLTLVAVFFSNQFALVFGAVDFLVEYQIKVRNESSPTSYFLPITCQAQLTLLRPDRMALNIMQRVNLNNIEPDVHGRISKQTGELHGVTVTQVTFGPGARWSEDLKDYAGTDSCLLPHVAIVLEGRLHILMDDGSEDEFGQGDVMLLPPGHDAWSVGGERCVFVEFSRGIDYYDTIGSA